MARDLPDDHPDVIADRRFRSANRWPATCRAFARRSSPIAMRMERLVQKLVRLYACALGLPAGLFRRRSATSSTSCA